jgi:hypothetical protein
VRNFTEIIEDVLFLALLMVGVYILFGLIHYTF